LNEPARLTSACFDYLGLRPHDVGLAAATVMPRRPLPHPPQNAEFVGTLGAFDRVTLATFVAKSTSASTAFVPEVG
jgi:hypothetical protein